MEQAVYIEHTDCFSVVFHGHYFSFLASARESALSCLTGLRRPGLSHRLLSAASARLASPAVLGDTLSISSTLLGRDSSSSLLLWQQSVSPTAGGKPHATLASAVTGFVSDEGLLLPLPAELCAALPVLPALSLPPLQSESSGCEVQTLVTPFREELCGPFSSPSESDVLRWFERGRTDWLGGGAGLKLLQSAAVLVVVTSVDDLRIDPAVAASAHEAGSVAIRSSVQLKRRGSIVRFTQTAWVGDRLMAQAEVQCACVDATTMTLMASAPQAVTDIALRRTGAAASMQLQG